VKDVQSSVPQLNIIKKETDEIWAFLSFGLTRKPGLSVPPRFLTNGSVNCFQKFSLV
jgi:hypothetical protein